MKRMLFLAAAFFCAFISAARADDITITINGSELYTENAPVMVDDRVLVPMRAIFEGLGAQVSWDETTYSAYGSVDGIAVCVPVGSQIIRTGIVNSDGEMLFSSEVEIDVPAQIIDDRTYVPVRAVAETLKSEVLWDNGRVIITEQSSGAHAFFYSSADDYGKLYRVDSDGVRREKLSDKYVTEVYYDRGYVYYISGGFLYRQQENGGSEEQITNYDTEVIGIEYGRIFCLEKSAPHKGILHEYGTNTAEYGYVMYPEKHGSYLYYNREGDTRMFAMNIDTYAETSADMGSGVKLSPFQCLFYNKYILVEDGVGYQNIFRFDADGGNRMYLNEYISVLCRTQQEDARVLYVKSDTQDIHYVWIDGSYDDMIVDMPEDCIYADVLAQNGDYIYYKNMYRKEIYRTDFDATENIYVGYGDSVGVFDNSLFILGDVLYRGDLDGANQTTVYSRPVKEYFAHNGSAYLIDGTSGNIVKTDYSGSSTHVTNDKIIVWTSDFDL